MIIGYQKQRAFTLAEMAIVVVLGGILLTMGLKMTVATLNNTAYVDTASRQERIKLALIGYLRTNGVLPCPDNKAIPNGTQVLPCTASAAAGRGVIPWVTLQLSRDTAQDGWGNFFSYRVANGFAPPANVRNWTGRIAPPAPFDIAQLSTPTNALTIRQGDGIVAPVIITTNAVAVIMSAGKNGFGARTISGQLVTAPPAANVDETTNATAATAAFVTRPYTENAAAFNGAFDDRIVYLLPQDLLQPLVTEQSVAVCKAYCPACTGPGTPSPYCTGAGQPTSAVSASSCIAAGNPYALCSGAGVPVLCTVAATSPVPIGNATPVCP